MTESGDNLVLEHLRHIRGRVDRIGEDMGDVKRRLNTLEHGQARILGQYADLYGDQATHQTSIDRILERIERIERRLELADG